MLLTAVLAYGHVLSAVAWLGGGLLFGFFIGPKLGQLSRSSAREIVSIHLSGHSVGSGSLLLTSIGRVLR